MSNYIGDFPDNAIVVLGAFTTNAADGGRESFSAGLEEADITIYSDDGDGTFTAMTLDASTILITENPGSQVGVYLVAVNMGNDADFTTGKDYIAVLYPDETVDSQSVAGVLAHWSCENRSVQTVRGAVASVTDGVSLADDAITAAKFDESTAFPLKSADTGATAVARTGADSDTLETLSDQIDLQATATALATAQTDLDTITGSDGVTLATAQGNYAPAVAGNQMDLVDAPNATAVAAIQSGLSTYDGGNITGNLSGSVGSVTGAVGSVTGNVGGNVTGSVGSLATQAKTDVNEQVVDALATDTYAEPGQGTPGATISLSAKIGYIYKFLRNKKTQTSTTKSIFNDDASTVDHKSTVSDDGTTYTEGELGTGP